MAVVMRWYLKAHAKIDKEPGPVDVFPCLFCFGERRAVAWETKQCIAGVLGEQYCTTTLLQCGDEWSHFEMRLARSARGRVSLAQLRPKDY